MSMDCSLNSHLMILRHDGIHIELDVTEWQDVLMEYLMTFITYHNGMTLIMTVIYIMVITSVHLGTRSYKQELDLEVWVYCFLEYAQNAPSFYPDEFQMAADSILCELHTTRQDITYDTARPIYLHLCNLMS